MSLMVTKFICSTMMSLVGIKVVKDISGANANLLSIKSILLMIVLILVPPFLHIIDYSYISSIIIYILTIITYKEILNISLIKSTISCGLMMIMLILIDVLFGILFAPYVTADEIRNSWYFNIISNLIYSAILLFISSRNFFSSRINPLVDKISNKKSIKIVFAIIIVVITMLSILYTISQHYSLNKIFTTNVILFLVFFLLISLLLGERNNFENLSDEYDNLFKYVQIFEDWIEREQLIRHEYKNQLAVIRNLTREKKVKDKIDSIVDDFINIDNEMITQLKNIPNGGLKGLLYYKISIARKNKINLTVDIDEKASKELSKLSNEKQKILTKLLGIYLDNAIEAATSSQKKITAIEIYKIKDNIKFIISNSYNVENDISNRNKKGFSTKGEGRGNGLYFANKLIEKNKWIGEKQEIVGNFYIESLTIKKV